MSAFDPWPVAPEYTTTPSGHADASDWPAPVPLRSVVVPPFPTSALGCLAAFVEEIATATQTPADLPALMTLATLATASAKRAVVEVRSGYVEQLCIFAVVALGPGTRKSAVVSAVTEPLREFEAAEMDRLKLDIGKAIARRDVVEKSLEAAKARAAKADAVERLALLGDVERLAGELDEFVVPVAPTLAVDDVTPEKAAALLEQQGERLAIISAEGGIFATMGGRYSNNAPNLDVFLKGHSGDPVSVHRIGRAPVVLRCPALTLGLAVQPDVIRSLADTPQFRGRGLIARFMFAIPVDIVGRRKIAPPPASMAAKQAYRSRILALLELPSDGEPRTLRLSREAAELHLAFEKWVEPRLAAGNALSSVREWASKLSGGVARIAGLLHMAEHAHTRAFDSPITTSTMQSALTIGRYLIPHAEAAHLEMGADACLEDAERILFWLQAAQDGRCVDPREARRGTGDASGFTESDVLTGLRTARLRKVKDLEAPLRLLEAHGYVRWLPEPERAGAGRRPARRFELNPATPPQYPQNPQNPQNPPGDAHSADSANCADGSVVVL